MLILPCRAILALVSGLLLLTITQAVWGQGSAAKGKTPELKPGTIIEYREVAGTTIHMAEFIRFNPVGFLIVRTEDGTEVTVFPSHARIARNPKKFKPKPKQEQEENRPAKSAGSGLHGLRTWSDASGKFKVEAEFVGLEGDKVQLKKANDQVISVPLSKLSTGDQDIAKILARPAPAAKMPEPENPFLTIEERIGGLSAPTALAKSEQAPARPVEAPEAASEPNTPPPIVGRQTVGPKDLVSPSTPKLISLPASVPYRVRVPAPPAPIAVAPQTSYKAPRERSRKLEWFSGALLFDAANKQILAGVKGGPFGSEANYLHVERFHLETGETRQPFELEGVAKLLDIDPSGTRLLTTPNDDRSGIRVFDLWAIEGDSVTHLSRTRRNWKDVAKTFYWGNLVDANHLLVGDDEGITLWKLPEATHLRSCKVSGSTRALTHDHKIVAAAKADRIYFLNSLTGEVLGILNGLGGMGERALSFDADENLFLAHSPSGMAIYDLATGEVQQTVSTSGSREDRDCIQKLSDRFLLYGDTLYDIKLGIGLCKYPGSSRVFANGQLWSGLFFGRRDNLQAGISHFDVPTPEIVEEADSVTERAFAMSPGVKVGIELRNLSFTPEDTERLKRQLISNIQGNGWIYTTDSPEAMAIAEIQDLGTEEIAFRIRGEVQTASFTSRRASLRLEKGGGIVWQSETYNSPPSVIRLKEGQSAQEVINDRFTLQSFMGMRIPETIINYPPGRRTFFDVGFDGEGRPFVRKG